MVGNTCSMALDGALYKCPLGGGIITVMSGSQASLFGSEAATSELVPLAELVPGQEACFFALLASREELKTKDGKPYFRVAFRDAGREVSFPIWSDTPWATPCREEWEVGSFYKLLAQYRESNYGPQLEIRKIRPVNDEDAADGFHAGMCLPVSRFDPGAMFDELIELVNQEIDDERLASLVFATLQEYRETLLTLPAATHNHHAHVGGFLEHVLSVARTCVLLADKYVALFPDLQPPLDKSLVVAGGVLHDIGKVRELQTTATGAEYTASGTLIGHILQGRDIVREMAVDHPVDEETLLRLEHLIVSHQRLPEWGSPKPPMTPEALIVHHADDLDAKLQMMVSALEKDTSTGPMTSTRNALRQRIFRGEPAS